MRSHAALKRRQSRSSIVSIKASEPLLDEMVDVIREVTGQKVDWETKKAESRRYSMPDTNLMAEPLSELAETEFVKVTPPRRQLTEDMDARPVHKPHKTMHIKYGLPKRRSKVAAVPDPLPGNVGELSPRTRRRTNSFNTSKR